MNSKFRQIVNKMKELDAIRDEIRSLEEVKAVEDEKKLFKQLICNQQNEDENLSIEQFFNLLKDFKYKLVVKFVKIKKLHHVVVILLE